MQPNLFAPAPSRKPATTPPSHLARLSTPTPVFCACCRRKAGACGYSPKGFPTLWMCGDDDCKEIIFRKGRIFHMTTPDFEAIEQDALRAGGRAGYAYLDSIDKENVFELEEHEAVEFFERIIDGFGACMRVRLLAPRDA